jgi:glutamyl-tRNA reductase
MAGIDYTLAGIDIREKFSFTKSRQQEIYEQLQANQAILGAVIVSTCNRTELYLSCVQGYDVNPFQLLCNAASINFRDYQLLHRVRRGSDAFQHLCRLACGAKSQIWGEDQIISQVKNSQDFARENNAIDSFLEVLFRTAITAAKKIKTVIKFSQAESSVALKTLTILNKQPERLHKVLVIGNGEVGKLVAQTLADNGFDVTMTLRQYKYSQVIIPEGVEAIDYAERYLHLGEFDVAVSATLSPHYTIEKDKLAGLPQIPRVMIDLAVPRDIEIGVGDLAGTTLYDIDTIAKDTITENHAKQLIEIDKIIDKYEGDFMKWKKHKELVTL